MNRLCVKKAKVVSPLLLRLRVPLVTRNACPQVKTNTGRQRERERESKRERERERVRKNLLLYITEKEKKNLTPKTTFSGNKWLYRVTKKATLARRKLRKRQMRILIWSINIAAYERKD